MRPRRAKTHFGMNGNAKEEKSLLEGVKNIMFDFGGVIIDLDKERCLLSFGRLGVDVDGCLGQYVQGGIFSRMERGEAGADEFFRTLRGKSGRAALSDGQIAAAWNDFLAGIPAERLECLARLKRKYRLFLLSNTNELHWRYAEANCFTRCGHTAGYYFEKAFLSYEMGLAKPDKRIFLRAIEDADVNPGETLFIDDSRDNCAAAHDAGLRVYHSQKPGDWLRVFG